MQFVFPSPSSLFVYRERNIKSRSGRGVKVVLAASGCVTKQVHSKWERKRSTFIGEKERKGAGNVAELL